MKDRMPGSALWHAWIDKPGRHHDLAIWDNGKIVNIETGETWPVTTAQEFRTVVTRSRLYIACEDPSDASKFPFMNELLGMKGVNAMLSRSKGLIGLVIKGKFWSFLLPYGAFVKQKADWSKVTEYFDIMGYEGPSLGSVTEKLFRATLPPRHGIHRPTDMIRRHFVDNSFGARVKESKLRYQSKTVWEYDYTAQYLHQARNIPSPFKAPDLELGHDIEVDRWPAFVQATIRAVSCNISPLPFVGEDGHITWEVTDDQILKGWWWKEELQDALEAGYQILKVHKAWVWPGYSDCMNQWANEMMEKLSQVKDDPILRHMVKTSYTTLPGRFQMQPEKLKLVPIQDLQQGDIAQVLHSFSEDGIISDWVIRPEPFMQATALVPQGSYIVMQGRRATYRLMCNLADRGIRTILSNTDNVYIPQPLPNDMRHLIDPDKDGMLKEKKHTNVTIFENRVVSDQDLKLPGVTGVRRAEVAEKLVA